MLTRVALNEPLRVLLRYKVRSAVDAGIAAKTSSGCVSAPLLAQLCGEFRSIDPGSQRASAGLRRVAGYRVPVRFERAGSRERRAAYYAAACPDTGRVPGTRIASRVLRDNEMLDNSGVLCSTRLTRYAHVV